MVIYDKINLNYNYNFKNIFLQIKSNRRSRGCYRGFLAL